MQKQPFFPKSWFPGIPVFALGTYKEVNLTHVWRSHVTSYLVNTKQTPEQVPLFRALQFCSYCGGGGGSWLGDPTMPHDLSSLMNLFATLGHVLPWRGWEQGELGKSRRTPTQSLGWLERDWLKIPSHFCRTFSGRLGLSELPWEEDELLPCIQ